MAIRFKEDFETGTTTMTVQGLTSGCTAEVTNVNPINGIYSGKFYVFSQAAWTEAYYRQTISPIPQVYVEALVRIDAFTPETTSGIIRGFIDVAGERAIIAYVGINNTRKLVLTYRIVGGVLRSKVSAVTLEVGGEYKIRLEASAGSSASFRVFLNDVEVTDLTTTDIDNTESGLISKIDCGVHNAGRVEATILVDDLLVSDTPLPIPTYTLMIEPTAGGTTDPPTGDHSHPEGTVVSVTAYPDSGYSFDKWLLDGLVHTENPIPVTMDSNHSLAAFFTLLPPPTHTLRVESTPVGVPFTINGVARVTPYSESLEEGNYVLEVMNMTGYRFVEWRDELGNVWTTPSITILLDRDKTLTVYYEEIPEHTLTVATTAGGTTNPAPGSYSHPETTSVEVTAIPDSGYNFNHWTLDGIDYTTNPITVVMDAPHTLTAYFSEEAPPPPETYNLTISTPLGGTTDPTPGIYEYDAGIATTITAIPDEHYRFVNWLLDEVARTENPITVTMDTDHTLQAVFEYVPPPPLTATISGIVKDSKTLAPIAGVTVTADGYADVTEIDGSYEFIDIPAITYILTIQKQGYDTQTFPIDTSEGGTFTEDLELRESAPPPIIPPWLPWAFGLSLFGIGLVYVGTKRG